MAAVVGVISKKIVSLSFYLGIFVKINYLLQYLAQITMQRSSSSSSNAMSSAVPKTADDKVAHIFQKYDDQNAEIAELESRVRQKESEFKVRRSESSQRRIRCARAVTNNVDGDIETSKSSDYSTSRA